MQAFVTEREEQSYGKYNSQINNRGEILDELKEKFLLNQKE